jgi:Sec-independent protein translocase protein TatA
MLALNENVPLLAFLDWPELVGLLIIVLVLHLARRLPDITRGLGDGMHHFDDAAKEAGESVGGIYGKPAAEALTPDNQTAELYDPDLSRRDKEGDGSKAPWPVRFWKRFWQLVRTASRLVRTFLHRVRH